MHSEQLWEAPVAHQALNAVVHVPGSKSLSNRYLILSALGRVPVTLHGLLISRDTELMMSALEKFGVRCEIDSEESHTVRVIPTHNGIFHGNCRIDCGLAGTVMRFVAGLAVYADGDVYFDGDEQAYKRPMKPLLDGLVQLGAQVKYHGVEGFLPFTITPPESCEGDKEIIIDSSTSSQFISALLLVASAWKGTIRISHRGAVLPSMPHIRMTMQDIETAGGHVIMNDSLQNNDSDPHHVMWSVQTSYIQLPDSVIVEPDLSNAAPFLCAALIAGGRVSVPQWPEHSTQPGALLPEFLSQCGARVHYDTEQRLLTVTADGSASLHTPGEFDLTSAGEIAPTLAGLAVCANNDTVFRGIAHLRGHETNRLEALVREINRCGGLAEETSDGLIIHAVDRSRLHGAVMETYHDHRMATFAAMLGLIIEDIRIVNISTTRKTLPDFVGMWTHMLDCS